MANVITVSALNAYVKSLLDGSGTLSNLTLRGEIANFRLQKSGHMYFTLRDEKASVKAVMFRGEARLLAFVPEDGMQVQVRCRASLYEEAGSFQLYVRQMSPFGQGSVQAAYEQLKSRLAKEGLFLDERKKQLPPYPGCIGLVTSRSGAALQDIRSVIERRWPLTRLLLAPVNVQGQNAPREIVRALSGLNADGRPELIIVARGGGSQEDLWVFNSEEIARAVCACRVPVISAIGHEIDRSILDYVADAYAPTPSAAAELAVPSREDELRKIYSLQQNIQRNMQNYLQSCYNRVDFIKSSGAMRAAAAGFARREALLRQTTGLIRQAAGWLAAHKSMQLAYAAQLAHSLDPYAVLARGYGMVRDESGRTLAADELRAGQRFCLCGRQQIADCRVSGIREIEKTREDGTNGKSDGV